MAYDEDLANRIRELLSDEERVTEKAMFGGLAFMVDGKMAVAAGSKGDILARVDPADMDELMATTAADVATMGKREMHGWVTVDPEHLDTEEQLSAWVRRSVDYARSLPAKR